MSGASEGYLKELVDSLIEKSEELDDFRMILRADVNGAEFRKNISALQRRGLDVNRVVRRLDKTHTKGIVVDGNRVLVGSHNWSGSGVTLNRDASLIFDDDEITQYFAEAFELDWDRARELRFDESVVTEAPRLAVGDEPPPGFVRMTLSDYLEG
jgi:phosphatidylserine/phosphatidylglycerophosphate/cardiolipin synthase-like enzyme